MNNFGPPIKPERKILEKDVEAYLVKRVKACGGKSYKLTQGGRAGGNRNGLTDRLVILPGDNYIWLIELKKNESCSLTPLQQSFADEAHALGVTRCICLKSKAAIDNWLRST